MAFQVFGRLDGLIWSRLFTLYAESHIFVFPYMGCDFTLTSKARVLAQESVSISQIQTLRNEMTDPLTPTTVFKCLADDTRVRTMLLITREGELCVCELTCALNESQPKVSRHLAQLRSCGLLSDRRQGQWVYYRLHPTLPDWVHQVLTTVLERNAHWLSPDTKRLDGMGDRPQRARACCESKIA